MGYEQEDDSNPKRSKLVKLGDPFGGLYVISYTEPLVDTDFEQIAEAQKLIAPLQTALDGRSYGFGDWDKRNKASKRPVIQASLRCKRWVKPSSLQRIPTPLKRCWMSHVHALSTIPLPSGKPSSLSLA